MSLLRLAGVVAAAHALSLSGSTYRINLDFGRETGTWMPPRWAVNAGRTEYTLDLTFEDAGAASVSTPRPLRGLALATGAKFPIEQASWRIDSDKGGSTLRCLLKHDGLAVSDCVLEAGELYLSVPFFPPATVSRKEGLLSIIAYRFGIRNISRRRDMLSARSGDSSACSSPRDRSRTQNNMLK